MKSGEALSYERLVLATGSRPAVPPIDGIDSSGVFVIEKSLSAMTALRDQARKAKSVVILGGGFIGAEFADELSANSNVDVHLVEMMPRLLYAAFDDEFCDDIAGELEQKGVKIHTGKRALSIQGSGRVESVALEGNETIPADMVIIGVGENRTRYWPKRPDCG